VLQLQGFQMNFRDRGHGIQIVRSTIDPETKKTKETVFGTVPKRTLEIDPALLEKATQEEQAEIKAWLERYKQVQTLKSQAEAYSLPDVVRTAVRYLDEVTDPVERGMLRDLMLDASKRLRRATRDEEEKSGEGARGGAARAAGNRKAA
jgi:hypothetical protein